MLDRRVGIDKPFSTSLGFHAWGQPLLHPSGPIASPRPNRILYPLSVHFEARRAILRQHGISVTRFTSPGAAHCDEPKGRMLKDDQSELGSVGFLPRSIPILDRGLGHFSTLNCQRNSLL